MDEIEPDDGGHGDLTDVLLCAAEELVQCPVSVLTEDAVLESLRRLERIVRFLDAIAYQLISECLSRSLHIRHGLRSPHQLLIQTLRISATDASRRVRAAKSVVQRVSPLGESLPAVLAGTGEGVRDGDIGRDHISSIADVMHKVPNAVDFEARQSLEMILAEYARTGTPEGVTAAGVEALAWLNPDGALTDDRDRRRRRYLNVRHQDVDLMSRISGELDPVARARLDVVLAKWARPGMNNPDDPESPTGDSSEVRESDIVAAAARDTRSAGQRNHDAFSALLKCVLDDGILGKHRGLPATVIITMTLAQLEESIGGVATTATGGILPIHEALAMAEKAHPVLVLFDQNGRPLHFGRGKRLASVDQRLALIAADRGCTRPNCDAPPSRCAVHHMAEWNDKGRTDIDNLTLACDSCHGSVKQGGEGWKTNPRTGDDAYAGRTEWTPPAHIDPERRPRVNFRHHPSELLDRAYAIIRRRNHTQRREKAGRQDSSGDDADPGAI
ncbi:HNH endonuclease signature motif containing protein [Rhodococcus sp. ARC_M6]|uniref:HNH endonuclease signature motif containing protein n=1 Tax=Rhodococcus sp. ARC_M6 TaxID=2928852 RepID=UPI001FB48135|nr:HNH endonuclease signature motif containing protein [Rhodococcus sp. ARC_M6]MCJ0904383.1 HNH endonuclease [Rhodococcus sp. ARC_M6]